ncbi:dephospho-CoA kinase [Chitinivorax tropicus]|uniref:Dephospho-CoA kinase n=2 Tax=Chitinivorax tropicus TaxID=714531 RepID=A0A840MKK0_9PROT|nr:dephospho-CoA kinase [Chitinivorax tropicus]
MDRKTMRELVFADVEAKNKLEQLLHPLIRETVLEELAHISASYTLLAVPLLVETGTYLKMVNRVLVIDCEEATQIHRVMARSKLTEAEVRAIMLKQASRKARLAFADDVINNDGTSDSLQSQVDTLDTLYNELSRQINQ